MHGLGHGAELADGRTVTLDLFNLLMKEEMEKLQALIPAEQFEHGRYRRAATLLDDLVSNEDFEEFLTLPGYALLG